MFGSASHSGFGSEPAIVVGNSMGASRSVLVERLSAMSYGRGTEQQRSSFGVRRKVCPCRRHCEHKRSNPEIAPRKQSGLLRRFAPRNDGGTREFKRNTNRKRHDRILLRLLQSLDLSRLPQHPAAGKRLRRGDFLAP